ncbi:MAG: Smr/MutS family protein [Cytophagales bacterium]|nr:Smr/MutS family protein [Cytophagales bacterium]MDW8384900.1 Smr/MutS family protein [Flammeovirgaceae bacterium]
MNVGDRVRSKHAKEKGIITRILSEKEVEVEIEEGFRISFLKSELVVVSEMENAYFGKPSNIFSEHRPRFENRPSLSVSDENHQSLDNFSQKGLFVFFLRQNSSQCLEIWLFNHTELTSYFVMGKECEQQYFGIQAGEILPFKRQKISQISYQNLQENSTLIFQLMFFQKGPSLFQLPQLRKINLKSVLQQKPQPFPFLQSEGYCVPLDKERFEAIDVSQIRQEIAAKQTPTAISSNLATNKSQNKNLEVDLHIESLSKEYVIEKGKELAIQLQVFEKKLDEAILQGAESITFIHGVGNGVLKHAIAKSLSQNPHIAYYKDAQKEKFGYGATYVKLK